MILSGKRIEEEVKRGGLVISPFDLKQLGPNSYNLRLHEELATYKSETLDMKREEPLHRITIPQGGLVLEAGRLYLGRTIEFTESKNFVPMLEGRSSIGRLGLSVHITAGFGDIGFRGFWTLEIFALQPIRIYPGIEVCQIFYHEIAGIYESYSKKYQDNRELQPSFLYRELS